MFGRSVFLVFWSYAFICEASRETMSIFEAQVARKSFLKVQRSDAGIVHELVFAVQQDNLDELDRLLLERSTPGNKDYQRWLTFEDIGSLTTNHHASQAVVTWLNSCKGVTITWQSLRAEYVKAEASIETWEALLNTEFYEWHDLSRSRGFRKSEKVVHRALQYSLPVSMVPHIAAVFNTIQLPPEWKPKYRRKKGDIFKTHLRVQPTDQAITATSNEVTVPFLNKLYKITSNKGSTLHQQSVFETAGEAFSPEDLAQFQDIYGLAAQPVSNTFGHDTSDCVKNDCYEGNLDVQYIMGVAQQTATIYWYTAGGDPFVSWITDVANTRNPPLTNSISWGIVEQAMEKSSLNAFNTEALKLAAMGVTITVSSGDNGAASDEELCNEHSGSNDYGFWTGTSWSGRGYFPSFPATSPYVTAVGATQGPESGNPEIACQSDTGGIITTGGGFSTYYPTPSWQAAAVANYFATLPTNEQPTSGYNPNGRAYPDVSFIGVWYQTVVAGTLESVFGTSASAPVFAAMISLVNAARAAQNKSSVGFLNPTLYAYGPGNTLGANGTEFSPYNDVISGNNKCMAYNGYNPSNALCCQSGFYATQGWDPLTGLGSVDFTNLTAMFQTEVPYVLESASSADDDAVDLWTSLNFIIVVIITGVTLVATCLSGIIYAICVAVRSRNGSYAAANRSEVALVEYPTPGMSLHTVEDLQSAMAMAAAGEVVPPPPVAGVGAVGVSVVGFVRNPLVSSLSAPTVFVAPLEQHIK